MKIQLPIWIAVLGSLFVPGTVRGHDPWLCPQVSITIPGTNDSVLSFRTGVVVGVSASFVEIPGDCNGVSTYSYKRWYWRVTGVAATPSQGTGPGASFKILGKGGGAVVFDLICRSGDCPDCHAELQRTVPFCVEDGPYFSDSCIQNATMDLGPINLSPAVIHLGGTISAAATLTKTSGKKECKTAYDCRATIVVTNTESVGVTSRYSVAGPFTTNGPGLNCTFIPTNPGVGTITMWVQQADPSSSCSIEPYYVAQTATYTVLKTDMVGYEPGKQLLPGAEIPEESEGDARYLQIPVNDDNDDELSEGHQDNQDTRIGEKDNDIVAVTLHPLDPQLQRGTMTLSVYPSESVHVFKSDGEALLSDYSVDLASPQGELSALASAPVTIYIEGMEPNEDVALSLTYTDGSASCSDEVHLQVMQVDLDVDSENDSALSPIGWTDAEDQEEDDAALPGKYIGVNDGDVDGDGIPNYADGYDLWNAGPAAGGHFTPVALELKDPIDLDMAKIKFTYSCSDPKDVEKIPAATPADSDRYNPASGHLRIWKVDGAANRKKAEVSDGGDFIKSGVQYSAQDLGFGDDRTMIFYVEGIHPSDQMGDQRIWVEVVPDSERSLICSDAVRCTLLKAAIVPDWDHNRKIEDADRERATAINPFRFWINDDKDVDDVAVGDSDVPGKSDGNASDDKVNGRCDLLDFFPVWLDIGKAMKLLPSNYNGAYVLRQANGAINFFQSDLIRQNAGDYLIEESNFYGWGLDARAHLVPVVNVPAGGVNMTAGGADLLGAIHANPDKGVLVMEGKAPTTSPLNLEIHKDGPTGTLLYETQLPLSLSSVEDMYRWINLRNLTGGAEIKHTDTSPPPNFPDGLSNGKQVVFVPGYANTEESSRGVISEVFKRLYQSGSRAMFTGLDWEGNEDPGGIFLPVGVYYHLDVANAFAIASNLAQSVAALPGFKYIMAHSLGNMAVSSAIKDHGLSAGQYYMLDAAVAIESYRADALSLNEMTPPLWRDYTNRLWASEWYRLWESDPNDGRNKLTWKNRFGDIPNAVNYYSSGEDVLDNNPANPPNISFTPNLFHLTQNSWTYQEFMKGQFQPAILPFLSCHGGWGVNSHYDVKIGEDEIGNPIYKPMDPASAALLTTNQLQSNSFFLSFYDSRLYATNGSSLAKDSVVRAKLLAEAIPALSRATGRNEVRNTLGGTDNNVDMKIRFQANGIAWPRNDGRWLHSDFRVVAYLFNNELYKDIVSRGVFK